MFPGIMRPLSIVLFLVIVSGQAVVSGQTTRAELIEKQRADKAAKLETYKPGKLEKILLNAEDGKLKRLFAPHNGFFVGYGYTYRPTGAGFALGGGFRHDLFDRRARVVFEAGQSFRNYNMVRGDFSLPRLARGKLEVGVEGIYRHQPQDDYFGPGPDSLNENRVAYLYKDTEFNGRAIVTLRPWFNVGTRIGRLAPEVGSGTDSAIPSIEVLFDDAAAPGLNEQPAFFYGEGFAEVDYRDEPGHTRAGGHYVVTLRKYADRDLDQYGFRSVDVMLRQFVPIFDKKRVFAFQLAVSGADADSGSRVPFYYQPTLGGGQSLRSVRDYRFRDTHMLLMNAEYRWEAFSALDMALFTDWGKVAPKFSDLDFSNLERAYGIGFRVIAAQNVIFRFDIATGGDDGIRYMFEYSKVF
jgi:hypothetical protein